MTREGAHDSTGRLRSLNHVLDILEVLHEHGPELGVTEIARSAGMTKSAVHGILANLEVRRYVSRTPSGRYSLGIKLAELGFAVERERGVTDAARSYLQELTVSTGESTHLSIYEDGEVLYLDKVTTPHAVQAYTRIGGRAPAYCVATGKAQLAFQDDESVTQVLGSLKRYTPTTIADPERLLAELENIRQRGFAINAGEWRADVVGVAAPVYDFSGQAVAAIGVSGPQFRFPVERATTYAGDVVVAAQAVSEHLGSRAASSTDVGV